MSNRKLEVTFLDPGPVAVTVAIFDEVPPDIWSKVVKVPVNTTYVIVDKGECKITLPVAPEAVPVIS